MRLKLYIFFLVGIFVLLIYRLSYWQIVMAGKLSKEAQTQYSKTTLTTGDRGKILASDGSFMVATVELWDVILDKTKIIEDYDLLSKKISPIINVDQQEIKSKIENGKRWVNIVTKIDQQTKSNIEAMDIKGISFSKRDGRFYPEASSSAHLLGFVGKNDSGDDVGYFGLEGYYNISLTGKSSLKNSKKDAKGTELEIDENASPAVSSGVNIKTSIDKRIQLLIERKLKNGIDKYGAIGGSITVMDPFNGNILAMASYPSYDQSRYEKYNDSLFRNPVISDTFEPGSIFKVIVMASGIDSGVVKPDTSCDDCSGPIKIDKYTIKTWNNKYIDGIKMSDVIVNSDNTGMVFVGRKMGQEKLYDYLDKFGIGEKTGVDLQGEVATKMRPKGKWSEVDLATTTFGQGIAVTGLQMIRAVSVIANGGYLVTPRVAVSLESSGWQEDLAIKDKKMVISNVTAKEVAQMMVNAVNSGESKWAKPKGFNNIAGKTGTAQIPVAGHYDEKNTNHSFIGFAPFDKPKFIMLVTLKSPQSSAWASETSAPLWFSIADEMFPYLGVQP